MAMKVSELIEILQQANPEEFVDMGYWEDMVDDLVPNTP